jgi:antitoxin ParD1/3/4
VDEIDAEAVYIQLSANFPTRFYIRISLVLRSSGSYKRTKNHLIRQKLATNWPPRDRGAMAIRSSSAFILCGMSIQIPAELETRLRAKAQQEGLTVEDYLARLIATDERAEEELTALALEGLESGEPFEVTSDYWQAKHRRLDESLKSRTQ